MDSRSKENHRHKLDSVHVCPKCGSVTKISEIDIKSISSGIHVCQLCGWSGPINVQIVETKDKP